MTPSPTRSRGRAKHDVIVVGAGHNGLVAACTLAQSGLDVVVLERDSIPGGAVSTVERFPGHRVDRGSSMHIMIRHTGIIERLGLPEHGLRYLDCDPWAFAPADRDDPPIVFAVDLDATCRSIDAACGSRDADAYRRFVDVWGPRSASVLSALGGPPTALRLARAFWGMPTRDGHTGRSAGPALAQEFLTSGDTLLDGWFRSERLKAALAWFGAQSGPPMSDVATAPLVGMAAAMHCIPPGRPVGGSGGLTDALVTALSASGGRLVLDAPVDAVTARSDGWAVRTGDGATTTARAVVAACHVHTTLDALAAGGTLPNAAQRWRSRIGLGPGIGSAIRVSTAALPDYRGGLTAEQQVGMGLLVTDRAHLARAHGDARAGLPPTRPAVLAMAHSALDGSLAPAGRHLSTLWAQWHPRHLGGGRTWDGARDQVTADVIAEMERFAPGFGTTVRDVYAQTPDRIEDELGLIGGNVMHVDMTADQMFSFRPHPDLGNHRVPGAPGLYLAGASTHPGGGVFGASGSIAAGHLLDDLAGRVARVFRRRR